jgi:hypothetical protein
MSMCYNRFEKVLQSQNDWIEVSYFVEQNAYR